MHQYYGYYAWRYNRSRAIIKLNCFVSLVGYIIIDNSDVLLPINTNPFE
jgi:hypothetical protein